MYFSDYGRNLKDFVVFYNFFVRCLKYHLKFERSFEVKSNVEYQYLGMLLLGQVLVISRVRKIKTLSYMEMKLMCFTT